MGWSRLLLLVLLLEAATAPAAARSGADAGQALLTRHCARCHAVELNGVSPLAKAPTFREVARRYPPESLAESLAEGIVTGHPQMPVFVFQPGEIGDIIAYLETLRGAPR